MSATDAFFESMSGVTTTGATVIVGLDHAAPGILLWRAIMQWLGGIGIIVMAVAILPILQVGGMQLFRVEAFDADKVLPRAAQIAGGISIVYVFLTGLAALVLWSLGLSGFDAVTHAMTSIATGGFSTHDDSIGYYDSAAVDWSICGFMILGSLPFVLYLRAFRGNLAVLVRDSQVRWFLIVVAGAVVLITWWLWRNDVLSPPDALRYGAFNVISVMTGTGYATAEFDRWGGFSMSLMFVLMFVGGCAGSTTCGIKIFRFQVLYATAKAQLKRLIQPQWRVHSVLQSSPHPGTSEPLRDGLLLFVHRQLRAARRRLGVPRPRLHHGRLRRRLRHRQRRPRPRRRHRPGPQLQQPSGRGQVATLGRHAVGAARTLHGPRASVALVLARLRPA